MLIRLILLSGLLASPAIAGTATCAGKVYKGITRASITTPGNIAVVCLWTSDEARAKPRWTLILNADAMCELEDLPLYGTPSDGQKED
jgi:hypothetical protein